MRYSICYVSNSSKALKYDQAEELLKSCQSRNESLDINGILLFSEGNFFQILEGEKQVVTGIFEKIKIDPRHKGLIQIIGRDIEQGSCEGYQIDIIDQSLKYNTKIPQEYIKALECIPVDTKKPMERMLTLFIAAH